MLSMDGRVKDVISGGRGKIKESSHAMDWGLTRPKYFKFLTLCQNCQ